MPAFNVGRSRPESVHVESDSPPPDDNSDEFSSDDVSVENVAFGEEFDNPIYFELADVQQLQPELLQEQMDQQLKHQLTSQLVTHMDNYNRNEYHYIHVNVFKLGIEDPHGFLDNITDYYHNTLYHYDADAVIDKVMGFISGSRKRPLSRLPPKNDNFVEEFAIVDSTQRKSLYDCLPSEPLVYRNPVLMFFERQSIEAVSNAMCETAHLRDRCFQHGWLMEACVLGVYVVHHRVLLMENGQHNTFRKINAIESFPKNVAGKWCSPYSELLIFPGLHMNIASLFVVLSDLQKGMELINKFREPDSLYQTINRYHNEGRWCNEMNFKMFMVVQGIPEINLIFRPAFTNIYFQTPTPKIRMTLEMLQLAFLVFLQFTLWALAHQDFATALVFVKEMERSVYMTHAMLSYDEELLKQYCFTMTQWCGARCLFGLLDKFQMNEVREKYTVLRGKMDHFIKGFYPVHKFRDFFGYPSSRSSCIETINDCFTYITIPKGWLRSEQQQQFVTSRIVLRSLREWAKTVYEDLECYATLRRSELFTIYFKIRELLYISKYQLEYKTLMCCLGARCMKLMFVWEDIDEMFRVTANVEEEYLLRQPSFKKLEERSIFQNAALLAINEQYTGEKVDKMRIRRSLIKVARKTVFDEIIYSFDQRDSGSCSRCIMLIQNQLPTALEVWFRLGEPVDLVTGGLPGEELPYFNQMMGMFFHGLSILYFQLNEMIPTPTRIDNARFLHALSCSYLRRPTVVQSITRAFLDCAIMTERCRMKRNHINKQIPGRLKCIIVTLRKLLHLLPVLYEACIASEFDDGPVEYDSVKLSEAENIFRNANSTLAPDKVRMYDRLMENMREDLGIRPHKLFQVLDGTTSKSDLRKLSLNYQPDNLLGLMRETWRTLPQDRRAPISGVGYCICSGCPVEQYHEKQEERGPLYNSYIPGLYDEIFSNFHDEMMDRSDDVFKDLLVELERLVDNAVRTVKTEIKAGASGYYIGYLVIGSGTVVSDTCQDAGLLLSNLKLLSRKLKANHPPLLLVTKALYKIDSIFNEGLYAKKLLRGKLYP